MNWNAIRTFILGSGIVAVVLPWVVNFIMSFLGCSGDNPATPDVVEVAACTGGTLIAIPLWLQATVGGLVMLALGGIKALLGSGTIKQNLFAPAVPVVATKSEASVGVVTAAQVAEPGPLK